MRCYLGETGSPPEPLLLKIKPGHRGGRAVFILNPAGPPHDGKVMDRQGSRQMALSG